MKKETGLGLIRQGALIYYYPLKFETKLDFDSLCEHIAESVEQNFKACREQLQATMDSAKQTSPNSSQPKCASPDTSLVIATTDTGFKVEMQLGCMKAYLHREQYFDNEYAEYKKIYGSAFVEMQQRIILPPMHIKLYNNKPVWLNAILILFTNKMGLLTLELPLVDVTSEHFKDCNLDSYVSSIIGGCMLPEETSEFSFTKTAKLYLNQMLSHKKLDKIFCGNSIPHIILADCEGMPEHIENLPLSVQKDLYEIIAAPIGERHLISTSEDAREYLQSHSWGKHIMKSFTSTKGGCLTLIDKAIVLDRKKQAEHSLGVTQLSSTEMVEIYESLIWSACINTEFSLTILALKQMNAEYVFQEKVLGRRNLHEIQFEYNNTQILISELQNACLGTVYEQLDTFEKTMTYYVNSDLVEVKMAAIDRILANRKSLIQERSQSLLSLVSLLLTAVFGLPAIHDTFSHLHDLFCSTTPDIPCISIASTSVVCWLLLLGFLIIWSFKTIRKS